MVSYGRGLEKKFDKLESIDTNKIVIVGGSNVNFGIDSDLMEVSLGVPVVNMGFHAGLNTFNIISPVTPFLTEGDILIISKEFNDELYGASVEVSNYFQFMPLKARWETYKNFDAIAPILKCHINNSQNNIINFDFKPQNTYKPGTYQAKAFKNDNLKKNVIDFEMNTGTYSKIKAKKLDPPSNIELFKYYQNLKTNLNERGIKVYFSIPAIADSRFSKEEMITYYQTLSDKTGIQLLSKNILSFPREKLSNTLYHLNATGRKERSLNLTNDLSQILNIKLKKINELFYASSTKINATPLKLNDFRQCKLIDSQLVFVNNNKKDKQNYCRVMLKDTNTTFNDKSFKIVVKGNDSLIKDLKFKAVGRPQDWDFIYKDDSKHVLIKNNVQGTIYKNGNNYIGISLNNINKYHNDSIKIIKIEISETPFTSKPIIELGLNKSLAIDSQNSNNELIIKNGEIFTPYELIQNRKYILTNQSKEIRITNLYSGNTKAIKKNSSNPKVNIQFPADVIEVYDLK
ncbi:MAG: hypothetical protein BM564_01720 [Bacteroidetes bacterium MedPE-SWsnd-G2]|nr:MAG: hypothetical protein BM564_01720 [Bacteroidetes bacterium MedPE-SWsnd-G2]